VAALARGTQSISAHPALIGGVMAVCIWYLTLRRRRLIRHRHPPVNLRQFP
jgi:hypothetical protein